VGVAIKAFRHKGLERFFASGSKSGIQAKHADRLRLILGRLNASTNVRDMNLPGLNLHELRGWRSVSPSPLTRALKAGSTSSFSMTYGMRKKAASGST
jgi:hypothetical protein